MHVAVVFAGHVRSVHVQESTRDVAHGPQPINDQTGQVVASNRRAALGTTALYCDVSEDTLRNAAELV